MKQKLFLPALLALLFTACHTESTSYIILGEINYAHDGDSIFIENELGRKASIIKDKKFSFKGRQDTSMISKLKYNNKTITSFILEKGRIHITSSKQNVILSGTTNNDIYQTYKEGAATIMKLQVGFHKATEKAPLTEIQKKENTALFNKLSKNYRHFIESTLEKNLTHKASVLILVENRANLTLDKLNLYFNSLPKRFRENTALKDIKQLIILSKATTPGKKITDLSLETINGKKVKLSDYVGKGKYVLIDFWASWCSSCIRSIPQLKETYKKYKKQGLEIVGISLDTNKATWEKAVKKYNLKWVQLSDLQPWNRSEVVKKQGLNSIPKMLLVDKKGFIIARGTTHETFEAKLHELFH